MTGSSVAFGIGGGTAGANVTVSSGAVNDGNWHHLVASWDADTQQMNLYLDGENEAAGVSTSGETRTGAAALMIGRCSTANRFFRGLLDDIQIFDRVLTLNDIAFLFHSPGLNLH